MVVRTPARLDSRVLRIGDALAAAGHDVHCVGYRAPDTARLPGWPLHEIDGASLAGLRRTGHAAALPLARVPRGWQVAYWSDHRVRDAYAQVRATRPDVVHAHDWDTLPIAARVAAETGCKIVYDTHEFASHEYDDSTAWRLMYAPFTRAIERAFIGRARAVITVSTSIARELQTLYALPDLPTVVRNVPDAERLAPSPVGEQVRVLFHGGITAARGMVETATSTAQWPEGFTLTIRGTAPPELAAAIEQASPPGRVTMVPAVPPAEVVRAANGFDIGIHPSLGVSKNDEYSLPNKFFEYLNAGLALCIVDFPEMASLVRANGVGRLIERPVTPAGIADAISGFTREGLTAFKAASHRLAGSLTWAAEAATLVELYERRVVV